MKIAFIDTKGINIKEIAFGGLETIITELAPRFVKNGHEFIVYCRTKFYNPDSYPKEIDGVKLKFLTSIETKNFGTTSHSFLAVPSLPILLRQKIVEICEGYVIAAGSVVTKSFPPNLIAVGILAKIIKSRFEK